MRGHSQPTEAPDEHVAGSETRITAETKS
jgi:hypothetical protein